MTCIRDLARAITAITLSCRRQVDAIAGGTLQQPAAADLSSEAMRPGVVGRHRNAFAETLLRIDEHGVVASRAAVIPRSDICILRTFDRIDQSQQASAVGVGR